MRHQLSRLHVRDDEATPLAAGFAAFLCCLAGYFLLLPLRDEAGVALGTDKLPSLFLASLFLTFFAAPLASNYLHRHQERAVQRLFRGLALGVLGFVALYTAAGTPLPADPDDAAAAAEAHHAHHAPGAATLTSAQAAVRVAFFLAVSLLNVVSVSALWARSADVFGPEQAGRLFGLLGAGATLGQLVGSLGARALAKAPVLGGGGGAPSLLPLLASAGMLELAGRAAQHYRLPGGGHAAGGGGAPLASLAAADEAQRGSGSSSSLMQREPSMTDLARAGSASRGVSPVAGTGSPRWLSSKAGGGGDKGRRPPRPPSPLDQLLGRTLEGYSLIRASPYLLHLCAYLALNYVCSSCFYFQKTLVVAQVKDAASRTAWFATINSMSALFILALQLLATSRVLRRLGLPLALSVLPATAGLLMAGISAWPTPVAVAAAEVLRKLIAYSLARPARESLFTVIGREEKYKAKMVLDTVVQRVGDTLAAALFQALVPWLGLGPAGLAAACVPVCGAWTAVAYQLGRRQQRLAKAVQVNGA